MSVGAPFANVGTWHTLQATRVVWLLSRELSCGKFEWQFEHSTNCAESRCRMSTPRPAMR